MVNAIDDDVVDVQHQVAFRFFENREQELFFGHRRICRRVVRNVFQRDSLLQYFLDAMHSAGDVTNGVFREWNRHQIVQVAIVATVAQVFGIQANIVLHHEFLDVADQLFVKRGRGADGQGQAMNQERVSLRKKAQLLAESAANMNPVLRRDFHEIDVGRRISHQLVS